MSLNGQPGPPQPEKDMKFTVVESCDQIKKEVFFFQDQYNSLETECKTIMQEKTEITKEFSSLQARYHCLKVECEKLTQERVGLQHQSSMYLETLSQMNMELYKQTELARRLHTICYQLVSQLPAEQQAQVTATLERAKHITMEEMTGFMM